mmetsp:Transcript_34675/g.55439  ORF Transcript_34675/g.55439 Transcript_34675/m.55439 type:complete len:198 (+) Transcript_34675:23-616(+)
MVGGRRSGRRYKYLDQEVPDEIGEERRAALQKIYDKNRKPRKRKRSSKTPGPTAASDATAATGIPATSDAASATDATADFGLRDCTTQTSSMDSGDHDPLAFSWPVTCDMGVQADRANTREMGVQADLANCLCQLRCEPPVRFPGECRNCYRNREDAGFWRQRAEKMEAELKYRESQLKLACLELRKLRSNTITSSG